MTVLPADQLKLNLLQYQLDPPPLGCLQSFPGLPGGGAKLIDTSPYGSPGTLSGPVAWQQLPSGLWVLSFGLEKNYIDCSNPFPVAVKSMSVVCWAYDLQGKSGVRLFGQYPMFYVLNDSSPRLKSYLSWSDETSSNGEVIAYYSTEKWYHWAFTLEHTAAGTRFKAYRDGALVRNSFYAGKTLHDYSYQFCWAFLYNFGSDCWNGRIGLMKLFNHPLPAFEVSRIYEKEKELFPL